MRVATTDFGIKGRPINASRVTILTGLSLARSHDRALVARYNLRPVKGKGFACAKNPMAIYLNNEREIAHEGP